MTKPVRVSLLWFGTGWQESGREAIRNAIASLTPSRYLGKDSDVPTLGDWWNIVRQYTDNSNTPVSDRVDVGSECFYTGPELNMTRDQVIDIGHSVFNKTLIDAFRGNLNCSEAFEVNENSIFHIVFSHTVIFLDGKEQTELMVSCSGNLQVEAFAGVNVTLRWARAPQKDASVDQCLRFLQGKSYLGPPNGDEKIDSLVGYILAKITEGVTNHDGRGWLANDGSGLTAGSFCESTIQRQPEGPPLFRDKKRKLSFNAAGLNGYRYIVQYIWDQKIQNCALKVSETCNSNAILLKQPKGYLNRGLAVNHTDGLQPYPPNQICQWSVNYPEAKFISFTINYLSLMANGDDTLQICPSNSNVAQCTILQSLKKNSNKNFRVMGSKATIKFASGDHVSFESRGWELDYSAGLCNGKEDVYDHAGIIGTPLTSFSYIEGLNCLWVLHGKPGTLVSLRFTYINISEDFDFLAIYNGVKQQIANFSGYYSGSGLPQLNLTGEVRIAFATQTEKGQGWSANFFIASPVSRNSKAFLVIIIIVSAVGVGIALAFVALALHIRRSKCISNEGLMLMRLETNREENLIGEGPSAVVYGPVLTDGKFIAVKARRDMDSLADLEREILSKSSSHPNIISLVGYARDGLQIRYLLFEFMSRGNLRMNLRERGETLHWEKRLAIALQICSAIQMLHMYLKPPIYHGNITSANILLDEVCNAKLAGFSNANYCSNEGMNPGDLSEMAEDIWSFGVVLVELLRGQNLDDRTAYKNFRSLEEINDFVGTQEHLDQRLGIPDAQNKIMGLAKLGEIAKWCIVLGCGVGRERNNPQIGDVLSGLKQVKQMFCYV
ncbi:hypothetical protein P3X46_015512 [Hevea brasiliensis]|uniref:Protein kinase domain-containing protein n=2 Tax=Hevea brasiliensis TaxID=3981 RepID=A0ABQ9M077_HEVBR|nr:hypothetical protein P3X46_015512 [Hevea brasiliensis]